MIIPPPSLQEKKKKKAKITNSDKFSQLVQD